MTLGDLIKRLEQADPAQVVPRGFNNPHSYRGYYDELAFEPAENVTVGEMLAAARSALGATFQGYKGGDFRMGEYTDVWLAPWGDCGESIGPVLLDYMLTPPTPDQPPPRTAGGADPFAERCAGCHQPIPERDPAKPWRWDRDCPRCARPNAAALLEEYGAACRAFATDGDFRAMEAAKARVLAILPAHPAPAREAGGAGDDDGRCTGMVDYPQPEGGTLPLQCGGDAGHAGACSPAIDQFSRWNTMRLVRRGY